MLIPNKKLREMNRRQQVKRRVGKYEVGRTIGEGTFAKVKFARNSETGEPVALKILDKEKVLKHKMAEQVFVIIELWILCFRIAVFYRLILILLVFFCWILQIRREIATMKLIKHPNVVQLYEVINTSLDKCVIWLCTMYLEITYFEIVLVVVVAGDGK